MVLIGAGRSFIAGADIRTFGNRPPPVPGRRRASTSLDASQKPVVAAIHGYALGGGFEIALASNYRIAVPSAKVGLPEVLIGILPGSGGTQRLPRLIGPKAALDMIVTGRHVPAEEAHRLGIIDELVPEGADLRQAAIAFARRVADIRPLPRIRDHDEKLAEAKADPGMFDAMRKSIARRARSQKAPYHCIAVGRKRLHDAVRRRHRARARALQRAGKLGRGAGPALCLFCRARGGAAARHPARHAIAPDQDRRRSSAPARWAAASR